MATMIGGNGGGSGGDKLSVDTSWNNTIGNVVFLNPVPSQTNQSLNYFNNLIDWDKDFLQQKFAYRYHNSGTGTGLYINCIDFENKEVTQFSHTATDSNEYYVFKNGYASKHDNYPYIIEPFVQQQDNTNHYPAYCMRELKNGTYATRTNIFQLPMISEAIYTTSGGPVYYDADNDTVYVSYCMGRAQSGTVSTRYYGYIYVVEIHGIYSGRYLLGRQQTIALPPETTSSVSYYANMWAMGITNYKKDGYIFIPFYYRLAGSNPSTRCGVIKIKPNSDENFVIYQDANSSYLTDMTNGVADVIRKRGDDYRIIYNSNSYFHTEYGTERKKATLVSASTSPYYGFTKGSHIKDITTFAPNIANATTSYPYTDGETTYIHMTNASKVCKIDHKIIYKDDAV